MIIFILMNSLVLFSAYLIVGRFSLAANFFDYLISIFFVYLSQIVLTETFLGAMGRLYLTELLLLNLFVLLLMIYFSKGKRKFLGFKQVRMNLRGGFSDNAALFLFVAIIVFMAVKLLINLVNPPFGWDSLNYHFTFAVEWFKHGNLDVPITVFDDPSPTYYPLNGSLYFLWLIFPFRSVFMADIGQLPFFIAAFLCLFSILRKLKVNRAYAFYAAALFVLVPNFFKQLQIAYVDIMVAVFFLSGVNFLLALGKNFSWQNTLFCSLSIGLLLGTKTVGLAYSPLLMFWFFVLLLRKAKKWYFLLIFIGIILLTGGFSYFRNFLMTGNPLYPLSLKIFGRQVLAGVMDAVTYRAHFTPSDYALEKILFHEGLGAQTVLFVFPAFFLALPVVILKQRKSLNFSLIYFTILPFLIYLVYRFAIPLANTRYIYCLLGVGMAASFYTIETLKLPKRLIQAMVVLCVLASISELAKRQELVASILITIIIYFGLLFFGRAFLRIIRKPSAVFLLVLGIFLSLAVMQRYYLDHEYANYVKMLKYSGFWPDAACAWNWLDQSTSGDNIAYAGRPVPFPLYGSKFKNNVYYVSVNRIEPARLDYFPKSRYRWGYDFESMHKNFEENGNYRGEADYAAWLDNLKNRNTDYLFIYSLHQTKETEFPIEDEWAKKEASCFAPVFSNDTIHIYEVKK